MSAREKLYAYAGTPSVLPESMLNEALDAYRAEVLAKAIGRLRAVPVQCTALTGPVWYGSGWNDAITTLEEIADYQTPDDEKYPGELQRLRALELALRVAAIRKDSLTEVRRLLVDHAEYEMDQREKSTAPIGDATPDFFQPDRTYRSEHTPYTAPELILTFRVEHVTQHPDRGHRRAIGWMRTGEPGTGWHGDFRDEHEFSGWVDVTDTLTTGEDGR